LKILLTGGLGYIGSNMVDYLLQNTDHEITILDRGDYQDQINSQFFHRILSNHRIRYEHGDIRHIEIIHPLIKKSDFIVHLAALVGEPLCQAKPEEAILTNQVMTKLIGDMTEHMKKPLIFFNTCSSYGRAEKPVDEKGELIPVSIYAITKVEAEKYLMKKPNCLIFRCATAYGLSEGRMRFDLIPAEFIKEAWNTGKIQVYGPHAHRPLIHINDMARLVKESIERFRGGHVFNVGSTEQNFTKLEIAERVGKMMGVPVKIIEKEEKRDYIVNFDKLKTEYNFTPSYTLDDGIEEIVDALQNHRIQPIGSNFE
jgi:nucleoside-diphosphate-sugar epimerase